MKTKKLIITCCLSLSIISLNAQEQENEPKGKAIVQVFGNFHSGFGNSKNDRGFDLDRSYLGYQYKIINGLEIKGVLDVGKSNDVNDFQRIAYIKNAQISWRKGNFTINGGLISGIQFKTQERFWSYRYVMKSFQDQYKFGNSADLGLSISYKFNDWLSADAIVVNGEGYKRIQNQDGLQYGIGTTITPVKGLTARVYTSLNEGVEADSKDIINYAMFLGYQNDDFSLGAEYNIMQNARNTSNHDLSGWSVYGKAKIAKETELFARFDQLSSSNDWNLDRDQSEVVAGVQFRLGNYVKVAPNFRMTMPKDKTQNNIYMAYVSAFFGL